MGGRGSASTRTGGAGAAETEPTAEQRRLAGGDERLIETNTSLADIRSSQRALEAPGSNRSVVQNRINASVRSLGSNARTDANIARAQPNNAQANARAAGSNRVAAVANRMTGNDRAATKFQARADEFGKRAARLFSPRTGLR